MDLVHSDSTLLFGEGDTIYWFPNGNAESKTESDHWFFFDEEVGILYSQGTQGIEIQKLVEVSAKLGANLLAEDNAIFLPSGEILDEAWKGESLWRSLYRWLKGLPRPTEFKPVSRWKK